MSDLKIDLAMRNGPIKPVWSFGVNTCHAVLNARADLNAHLRMAREIGLTYVRAHNIFSEQVGFYAERDGKATYDFTTVDTIYDNILASGMLPFVELSFCPIPLKSGETTIAAYKANTSVPNSFEAWSEVVVRLVEHCIERYGIELVSRWYFELWNEPDIAFFAGDQSAYFELYDHTAVAIKSVSERLRVGGPATARCKWIPEFLAHLEAGSPLTGGMPIPCDFISTHAYPSDVEFIEGDAGDVELKESTVMYELFSEVRTQIDASSCRDLPLFMGEWNSSAGPYAENHDEKNNGAFIVKTLVELRHVIDGSLYWNVSDIYEEAGFHYTPFHGGYGIFTVNGIPKSSYHAFAFLSHVRGSEIPTELDAPDGCGALASYDDERRCVSVIAYHYQEPNSDVGPPWRLTLTIGNAPSATASLSTRAVNDRAGSAYELWREMGSPDYLTLSDHRALAERAEPEHRRAIVRAGTNGVLQTDVELASGDIALLELSF
ncbi:MAG: GH39 family glycosyl hydrolase [Spirochaetales bacterium]